MLRSLFDLFLGFARIGLFGYGGGNQLIPMVQSVAVPRWLGPDEFSELVGINFAFPGLSAIKLAGVVGMKAAGLPGLLVSVAALTFPGLLLMVLVYDLALRYRTSPVMGRLLIAMGYAAPALLLATAWLLFRSAPGGGRNVKGLLLAGAVAYAMVELGLSPLVCVLAAALVGLLIF